MKYINATKVLPKKLILEIQKYVQGETLYIPKQETNYQKWDLKVAEDSYLIVVYLSDFSGSADKIYFDNERELKRQKLSRNNSTSKSKLREFYELQF